MGRAGWLGLCLPGCGVVGQAGPGLPPVWRIPSAASMPVGCQDEQGVVKSL